MLNQDTDLSTQLSPSRGSLINGPTGPDKQASNVWYTASKICNEQCPIPTGNSASWNRKQPSVRQTQAWQSCSWALPQVLAMVVIWCLIFGVAIVLGFQAHDMNLGISAVAVGFQVLSSSLTIGLWLAQIFQRKSRREEELPLFYYHFIT
jgi:hypothetical protein